MLKITKEYRRENARLHKLEEGYGTSGWMWCGPVYQMMKRRKCKTLLDYGCGKATLYKVFPDGFPVYNYDPAVTEWAEDPVPADFVACLDVMEHVEPKCLPAVLHHIKSKMLRAGFMNIALVSARKKLSDGRNAHLIVEDMSFWMHKLERTFSLVALEDWSVKDSLNVYLEP